MKEILTIQLIADQVTLKVKVIVVLVVILIAVNQIGSFVFIKIEPCKKDDESKYRKKRKEETYSVLFLSQSAGEFSQNL